MRKSIVLGAMLLLCSAPLLHCQEFSITLTPRLEALEQTHPSEGESHWGWGSSSIYTFVDLSFGEHWSLSASNHWLQDGAGDLYRNSKYAWENDWVDWFNVTYTTGNWAVTLGKDCLSMGGFEYDDNDVDCYDQLMSATWYNMPFYQWGGKVAYSFNEGNSLELQVASSPYKELYFQGLSYGLCWRGQLGERFSTIWSINGYDAEGLQDDVFLTNISLGNRLTLGECWALTYDLHIFDMSGRYGDFTYDNVEHVVGVTYECGEYLNFKGKFGQYGGDQIFYGLAVEGYPFGRGSGLRCHLVTGSNPIYGGWATTFGVTVPFTFER